MYTLTYKGRAIGQTYSLEKDVISVYIRMNPVFLGLGWSKCQ